MFPDQDLQARRLFVSAAVAAHNSQQVGRRVPTNLTTDELLRMAQLLGSNMEAFEQKHRLDFYPSYPGSTPGTERTRNGLRLVLACKVSRWGQAAFGVAYTTLIPGRPIVVSIAPAEAQIPDGWSPVARLS